MSEEVALVKLSKAKTALIEAKSLVEIISIRDIATAAATYAKAARLGLETQNEAAEVKIAAERKAGEMLRELPRNEGGHSPHRGLGSPPSYEDLGIERHQAQRWQKEALLPEKDFKTYVNTAREKEEEITSKAVYDLAKNFEKNNGRVVWNEPALPTTDKENAFDNLAFAATKQAIRDAASGKFGEEPGEWLLDNEWRELLEKRELPLTLIDDWVHGGCKNTPLHEVLIEMLNGRWGIDGEE
jgi:hypothetical protein